MKKHYLQRDVRGSHVFLYESIDGKLSLDPNTEATGRMPKHSLKIQWEMRGRFIEIDESDAKIAAAIRPKVHRVAG